MREKLLCPKPIEVRPVTEKDPYNPQPADPVKYVWFRADGALADSPALHKYLLAYASDFGLLTTSLLPHGKSVWHKDMQVASLDHAMWFHHPTNINRWHLYVMDSPVAAGGRGHVRRLRRAVRGARGGARPDRRRGERLHTGAARSLVRRLRSGDEPRRPRRPATWACSPTSTGSGRTSTAPTIRSSR